MWLLGCAADHVLLSGCSPTAGSRSKYIARITQSCVCALGLVWFGLFGVFMSESMLRSTWDPRDLEAVALCPFCRSPDSSQLHGDLQDITFHNVKGHFQMDRCGACKGMYLNPRPKSEVIHQAYLNYYTHNVPSDGSRNMSFTARIKRALANDYRRARYGANVGRTFPGGHALLNRLPEQAEEIDAYYRYVPKANGKLLDFGCGNGGYLKLVNQELGWDVIGVDFDPAAIETVRDAGFRGEVGGPEVLDRWNAEFDAITMSHVIEHLYEPAQAVRAAFRALKPGGFLYAETPNATAQCHDIFGTAWRGLEAPRHISIPSWTSMQRMFEDAGFERVNRHPRRNTLEPMFKRSSALENGDSSEDPAALSLPGPTPAHYANLRAEPETSEYVTMTAFKPK